MKIEEELVSLREENKALQEQLAQRDELIQHQQALLAEQNTLIQPQGEQMCILRTDTSPLSFASPSETLTAETGI